MFQIHYPGRQMGGGGNIQDHRPQTQNNLDISNIKTKLKEVLTGNLS